MERWRNAPALLVLAQAQLLDLAGERVPPPAEPLGGLDALAAGDLQRHFQQRALEGGRGLVEQAVAALGEFGARPAAQVGEPVAVAGDGRNRRRGLGQGGRGFRCGGQLRGGTRRGRGFADGSARLGDLRRQILQVDLTEAEKAELKKSADAVLEIQGALT